MGRMLNAFKQIDQKRGKSDAESPQMTQPMPSADEIAEAEAQAATARSIPDAPPSSLLTGEEIAVLGGDQAARTVDHVEQEMRELENLLSLEREAELPLRLDADPLGLRQAQSHPTEAYKPPAGDGLAHDPVERADESPAASAWLLRDGLPEDALLKLDDPETDLMHFALLEQARDRSGVDAATPFEFFASEGAPAAAAAPQESSQADETVREMEAAATDRVKAPRVEEALPPTEVHWPFVETPLQREDHDRLARQVVDQLPRSLPASLMLVAAGRNGARLPAVLGLARALAERDDGHVLLIDADAHQREVTRRLNLTRAPGLFDLLGHGKPSGRAGIPTDFEGLDFLPTGGRKTRTANEPLRSLLAEFKRTYRFVILETGGGGAPLGDMLAQVADAVYLMVELGMTSREDARKAARKLRQGGACLRGCVLAGLSPSEASMFRPTALLAHA